MKRIYERYKEMNWKQKLGFFTVVFLIGIAIQTIADYLIWWWMK